MKHVQQIIKTSLKKALQELQDIFRLDITSSHQINKLLVISSFPQKGSIHSGNVTGGVAPFTKYTLLSILDAAPSTEITVLAERTTAPKPVILSKAKDLLRMQGFSNKLRDSSAKPQNDQTSYTDDGMSVKRMWQRNSFGVFFSLLREIALHQQDTETVMIQMEFNMFGSFIHILPLPFFMLALLLLDKRIVFVSHQVAPNLNELHGHINIAPGTGKAVVLNIGIKLYYAFVLIIASKVIVFEQILKNKLDRIVKGNVVSIPLGVEERSALPTKEEARKKLNLSTEAFVTVSFGYIAWYKGSDWLISAFSKLHGSSSTEAKRSGEAKKVLDSARTRTINNVLILAGGPTKTHLNEGFYNRYINKVKKQIKNMANVRITGFVPEAQISLYYQAADVIVFPYRAFMSASGALSLAFSFQKPVLFSQSLEGLMKSEDFAETMATYGLKKEDLFFTTQADFQKKLTRMQQDVVYHQQLINFSSTIAAKRSWKNVGATYMQELFGKQDVPAFVLPTLSPIRIALAEKLANFSFS